MTKRLALPLALVGIGLVLLTYMIMVEGEPGALPLLLILAGIGSAIKTRLSHNHSRPSASDPEKPADRPRRDGQ